VASESEHSAGEVAEVVLIIRVGPDVRKTSQQPVHFGNSHSKVPVYRDVETTAQCQGKWMLRGSAGVDLPAVSYQGIIQLTVQIGVRSAEEQFRKRPNMLGWNPDHRPDQVSEHRRVGFVRPHGNNTIWRADRRGDINDGLRAHVPLEVGLYAKNLGKVQLGTTTTTIE